MESTLLPTAERLRQRRQEDVNSIFSSHSAMMACTRVQKAQRGEPCPLEPTPSMSAFWQRKAMCPAIMENQAILLSHPLHSNNV